MLTYSVQPLQAINFKEIAGKGIMGSINSRQVKLGSRQFIDRHHASSSLSRSGEVYLSISGFKKGVFRISNQYRDGVPEMITYLLAKKYDLQVLSGDNDAEKSKLESFFGKRASIHFHQSPQEKLNFIKELKTKNSKAKVLMLGDGLNDAGALKQSDVGVAVSENTSQFTPACDAILDSNEVSKLHRFIEYARSGRTVITWSFILSILYNIVGLSFAVQGSLSPLIAAILMPVSSISIVTFVTLATSFSAKRKGL